MPDFIHVGECECCSLTFPLTAELLCFECELSLRGDADWCSICEQLDDCHCGLAVA